MEVAVKQVEAIVNQIDVFDCTARLLRHMHMNNISREGEQML